MQLLGRLSELNKVTLVRIPEHQGIPGNKETDSKKLIKKHLELEHRPGGLPVLVADIPKC